MILLEGCKWRKTKGHNRFIIALRMLFNLTFNFPMDDKLGKQIADHVNNRLGGER